MIHLPVFPDLVFWACFTHCYEIEVLTLGSLAESVWRRNLKLSFPTWWIEAESQLLILFACFQSRLQAAFEFRFSTDFWQLPADKMVEAARHTTNFVFKTVLFSLPPSW